MKHLDLRMFWLRDQVEAQIIAPEYVPTQDMAADIFTKALAPVALVRCRSLLGMVV